MPTVAPVDLDDHCLAVAFLGEVPLSQWPPVSLSGLITAPTGMNFTMVCWRHPKLGRQGADHRR
jgi:hypothetical protein